MESSRIFKEEVECDMMVNKQEVTTLTDKTHFEVSRSVTLKFIELPSCILISC